MAWPPLSTPSEFKLALLALIKEEPASSYRLMQKLDERTGGYYRARAQTVYPLLRQLEDERTRQTGPPQVSICRFPSLATIIPADAQCAICLGPLFNMSTRMGERGNSSR